MSEIQLEMNLDNLSENDLKLALMQKQISDMHESMGKVRRKLFGELGEVKKLVARLQEENELLHKSIKESKNEQTDWIYAEGGYLFDVRQSQKKAC